MGNSMVESQREFQETSIHPDAVGSGQTKLAEEILLMLRKRMQLAKDAGISKIKFDQVTLEQATALVDLLERETRR
jgi:Ni2+-binding GTPase involved in maturation of urease and hydrogenase